MGTNNFRIPLLLLIIMFNMVSAIAQNHYNILDYGAVNDTSKLSTNAINKAIQKCYSNGGGRVVVPPGNYKSGTITLLNNVELYLERGATLYASTAHKDFPQQKQTAYQSQKDPGGWFALIYAAQATNIGISGNGTINGQGMKQLARPGLPGGDRDGRPRSILFISCSKVSVKGITMLNSGIWNQHYLNCEDVLVTDVNVYNHSNRNNDGIDIDGCRRFMLSDSMIDSDDDGIVLKSTGKAGCEDITITNCIVSSFSNAIKCGTESTGGFKNITISNCVVKPSKDKVPPFYGQKDGVAAISLIIVDGGIMDGVNVNNIVVEGTQCPIYVRLGNRARKYTDDAPEPKIGQMRNIQISNINAYNTGNYGSSITAVKGAVIENVSLNNIQLQNKGGLKPEDHLKDYMAVKEDEKGYPQPTSWRNLPSYGFFIRHVKNIALSAITLSSVNKEERIPLLGVDVDKISIYNFNAGAVSDKLKFRFSDVKNYSIDEMNKVEILK